ERERRATAVGWSSDPTAGGSMVDGIHSLRGGRAGRSAAPGCGGDLLSTGDGTVAEHHPIAIDVGIAELVAFRVGNAGPADGRTDHGPGERDTRTDADAGHAAADGRPFGASQLSAVAHEVALSRLTE